MKTVLKSGFPGMAAASLIGMMAMAVPASAATVYLPGVASSCATCVFGNHLISPESHPSVAGVGGSGLSNTGDVLDGARTYIYDLGGATDLSDGVANRGDAGFAMMIWDVGTPLDTVRLYTHQDHYFGGPITTDFEAQDVMEYSVWGSNDGDNFVLLSDVVDFDINGGSPTYTFAGTAPTFVYRGGSTENGILNAYTRDYTFGSSYQFFGIRASSISIAASDADPELDALAFNEGPISTPEPGTLALLAFGLAGIARRRARRAA